MANDLAASNPDKLKEMQELFLEEAAKYNVLPLDDRVYQRFNAAIAGRPDLMGDRPSLILYFYYAHCDIQAKIESGYETHTDVTR